MAADITGEQNQGGSEAASKKLGGEMGSFHGYVNFVQCERNGRGREEGKDYSFCCSGSLEKMWQHQELSKRNCLHPS